MRIQEFFSFMQERERVRLRKEAGLPFPWTEDQILQTYKFTNVKREHDRTSRELLEGFYKPNMGRPSIVFYNCALARYFGTSDMAIAVGWQREYDPEHIKQVYHARVARGLRTFTGAYVITNQGIKAPKIDVVVDHFLKDYWAVTPTLEHLYLNNKGWKDIITTTKTVKGFGGSGFMAKEVTLDFIMAQDWNPRDFNEWCPAGPGARRGVARIMGCDDLTSSEAKKFLNSEALSLQVMRELYDLHGNYLDDTMPSLVLHDIQFQLCEFDKYERVRLNQGRPRAKYKCQTKESSPV